MNAKSMVERGRMLKGSPSLLSSKAPPKCIALLYKSIDANSIFACNAHDSIPLRSRQVQAERRGLENREELPLGNLVFCLFFCTPSQ